MKNWGKLILIAFLWSLCTRYLYDFLIEESTIIVKEKENLLNFYDIVKSDWIVIQKLESVNIDSLAHHYNILKLKLKYGFNNETCTFLYKFSLLENVSFGDLTIENSQEKEISLFEDSINDKQKLRIFATVYLCCLIMMVFAAPSL